ncbi:MAG: hypothetical protein H0W61_00595 [Bacteroidetes bacterium]|nr:hypothetical protein [Bacteroidota bacterium]
MKITFQLLAFFLLVAGPACSQKKMHKIKVSCIQPYCGGARPSPEMVADGEKIRAYVEKTVILVSEKGKVDSAKTDKDGNINKKLAIGTYKLFEPWRYYKKTQSGDAIKDFDKECLKTEWKKHFMEVTITKSTLTQKSDSPIILNCSWDAPCLLESIKVQRRPE